MNLAEFQAHVTAQREAQRKANLAKSQAFLATLANAIDEDAEAANWFENNAYDLAGDR